MARVDVTSTARVDFGDLGGRLLNAERRVLTRYRDRTLNEIKEQWIGWVYAGRPAGAPRGVSLDAWRARVDTREGRGVLTVTNAARDWRAKRPYVKYVHRAGSTEQEWRVVWLRTVNTIVPALTRDLAAEIVKSLKTQRPPTRIRKARPDTLVTSAGLVL